MFRQRLTSAFLGSLRHLQPDRHLVQDRLQVEGVDRAACARPDIAHVLELEEGLADLHAEVLRMLESGAPCFDGPSQRVERDRHALEFTAERVARFVTVQANLGRSIGQ